MYALPTDPEHFGLIHFDLELDNLVSNDDSFAIIDFDDCAQYWYAADIAFALRDLYDGGRSLDDPSVRAFLDGYSAQTAIDAEMVGAIPIFSRLSRLFGFARVTRSLDIVAGPAYPDWMNGLIATFEGYLRDYRESL